jgi:hypothetical protein
MINSLKKKKENREKADKDVCVKMETELGDSFHKSKNLS